MVDDKGVQMFMLLQTQGRRVVMFEPVSSCFEEDDTHMVHDIVMVLDIGHRSIL
jgi:hypothetical protein